MKRALVTGSAGFVGRHMYRALQDRDFDVVGIDIRDGADALDYFDRGEERFDIVVHCAAVVGGRTMIDGAPLRLAVEDLMLDASMFRWAMRTRPRRVVAFSSSAAYPTSFQDADHHVLLEERHLGLDGWIGAPDATYGWVKLTLERLAAEANAEGIRTFVFRPFSGYGGDQNLDYPFPAIVNRAFRFDPGIHVRPDDAVPCFQVWGHPESTRDWVHIDDVVACVFAHLDADVVGPVNICTGIATSFQRLASLALDAAGHYGIPILGDRAKPMGVFHRVGDPTQMRQVYTPRVFIEEGVDRAMRGLVDRAMRPA